MEFNMLDYLLVLLLLVGTFGGVMQGIGRLLIDLLSLYIGLVASLLLYRPLGQFFRELLPAMSTSGSQALAFAFLMVLIVGGLSFVGRFVSKPPEEKKRSGNQDLEFTENKRSCRDLALRVVSQVGGLIVGFIVAVVWISLFLAVLQFLLSVGADTAVRGGAGGNIRRQLQTSALVPIFNYVVYLIYRAVRFWLPGHTTPAIFSQIIQF